MLVKFKPIKRGVRGRVTHIQQVAAAGSQILVVCGGDKIGIGVKVNHEMSSDKATCFASDVRTVQLQEKRRKTAPLFRQNYRDFVGRALAVRSYLLARRFG